MKTQLQKGGGLPIVLAVVAIIFLIAGIAYYATRPQADDAQVSQESVPSDKEGEEMMEKEEGMMEEKEDGAMMEKEDGAMVDKETEAMMMKAEGMGDTMMKDVGQTMMQEMMTMSYQYSGQLLDVTGGKTIRGVNTGGASSGVAKASFADGTYSLLATFEDVPDPQGIDFYEGWVVRKGAEFHVLSTGRVKKIDGVYTNTYSSGEDLTDHDFYVLTLEPDDGNPAPADHIVEGTMTRQ